MLTELCRAGIKCTYILTHSLPYVIREATKVIIGASCIMANGDVMSRVGTAVVCMAAHDAKVPVMVLCESYKFSDNLVRLDSFVWNEFGIQKSIIADL
jgi:translation initiation factor eIF-2B subunit delta